MQPLRFLRLIALALLFAVCALLVPAGADQSSDTGEFADRCLELDFAVKNCALPVSLVVARLHGIVHVLSCRF